MNGESTLLSLLFFPFFFVVLFCYEQLLTVSVTRERRVGTNVWGLFLRL